MYGDSIPQSLLGQERLFFLCLYVSTALEGGGGSNRPCNIYSALVKYKLYTAFLEVLILRWECEKVN